MNRGQITTMLAMQDKMNAKVNPDWFIAGYPWLRAAMIEGAEAMEHHGWKWWKKQEVDHAQLRIELVDIWHFAMSDILIKHRSGAIEFINTVITDPITVVVFDGKPRTLEGMTTLGRLDLMIGLAAADRFSISLFKTIMDDMGMSWDDLYSGYVAKNVLNMFRQDHGYKAGTYIKMWCGEEDNVSMAEIVSGMDLASPTFETDLYAALDTTYASVLLAAQ